MCTSPTRSWPEAARSPSKRATRSLRAHRSRTHDSASSAARRELSHGMHASLRGARAPENEPLSLGALGHTWTMKGMPPIPRWLALQRWRRRAAQCAAQPCGCRRSAGGSGRAASCKVSAHRTSRDRAAARTIAVVEMVAIMPIHGRLLEHSDGAVDRDGDAASRVRCVADSCWRGPSARDRQKPCR